MISGFHWNTDLLLLQHPDVGKKGEYAGKEEIKVKAKERKTVRKRKCREG